MKKAQEDNLGYDQEYTMLLFGYDVAIVPSDMGPDYFYVTLHELGAEVFGEDIPIPPIQPNETNEESINNVAQTAIDMFESQRGTLGEGAGAMEASVKKLAFMWQRDMESFYMKLKGTPYEEMAYNLIERYYEVEVEEAAYVDAASDERAECANIEHQLKMLNLQRMQMSKADTKVIIIQATYKESWIGDAEEIQRFLDKFISSPLEGSVVKLISSYLDLKEVIRKQEMGIEDFWESRSDIRSQMESLEMEALQVNVVEKIPTSGLDAFPAMGEEIAELMDGVAMDEPLEPMSDLMPFTAGKDPEEEDEFIPVEDRIEELGEFHKGLDVAEVIPPENKSFEIGDEVKLSKEFEVFNVAGALTVLSKGALGVVESLGDGTAENYVVRFLEDQVCIPIPSKILTKK